MEGPVSMLLKSSNVLIDSLVVSRMTSLAVTSLPVWGRGFAATTSTTAKAKTKAPNSSAEKVPRSVYNVFTMEAGPGLMAGKQGSLGLVAEAWKQTSAEERARLAEKLVSSKKAAAPKAPRSAWNVFIHEAGPSILAQRPDLATLADRMRAIGAAWKSLPDAGKQKYHDHFNHIAGKH